MYRVPTAARGIAGRRGILALSLSLTAIVCVIFSDQAGPVARASGSSQYASYPALEGGVTGGLPQVDSRAGAAQAGDGGEAGWPTEPPQGVTEGWPIASSIRALDVSSPNLSAWAAKSLGGGVCVLVSHHQSAAEVPSVAYSCTVDQDGLARGATAQLSQVPDSPGKVYVAGVVPSGVTSMEVTLADGDTQTVPVADGAWTLEADGEPAGYRPIAEGA